MEITRRELLRKGAHALGAAIAINLVPLTSQKPSTPQSSAPKENSITPSTPMGLDLPPKKDYTAALNEILSLKPQSEKRKTLESNFFEIAAKENTLETVDKGLWVTSNAELRRKLLDLRYSLRSENKGLTPIPEDKIAWAKAQGIHPETLGICLDAYDKAKNIINILLHNKKLRDDTNDLKSDDVMINPGGMAKLVITETGLSGYGFVNLGQGTVFGEINEDAYPNSKKSLTQLCQLTSQDTGIKFIPENIQGSLRGGAFSIQFLPNNALRIYNLIKQETGHSLNIFNPTDATIMSWVFLAMHEWVGKNEEGLDDYRYGYLKGNEEYMEKALLKWNKNVPQMTSILATATDYYPKFIGNMKYDY